MAKKYTHLKIQERSVLMIMRADACPMREIARFLGRSPSSISRELARTSVAGGAYDASQAHARSQRLRSTAKKMPKLDKDSDLFKGVHEKLKLLWSPQQIASALKAQWPNNREKSVSHETIYNAIYLHPRGALKRELVACLRHHNQLRKPRSRGKDRRGQIKDMQSIHIRPPEVEDRVWI